MLIVRALKNEGKLSKRKAKSSDLEPETPLDSEPEGAPEVDRLSRIEENIQRMDNQYNNFVQTVTKLDARTQDILQSMIRPPELPQVAPGNGEQKPPDPRSKGISDTMNKKFADASIGELVQAGDLCLRVNERRQGLTDLEEFLVTTGKDTITGFGSAKAHGLGRKDVES